MKAKSVYEVRAHLVDTWVAKELANPQDPWIIEDFFPRAGFTIIAGRPKLSYKTWWALLAASCMASGRDSGPFKVREQCNVLYIDKEASAHQAALRFRLLEAGGSGIAAEDTRGFHYMQGHPFLLTSGEHIAALCKYVAGHEIKYVFIDTFSRSFMGNENDAGDVMKSLSAFEHLRTLGCGMCLVHHSNKAGYNQAGHRLDPDGTLRGSSAMAGAYESILSIQEARVEGQHRQYLIRGGKYVTHEAYEVKWTTKKNKIAKLTWTGPMDLPEADGVAPRPEKTSMF